MHKRQITNADKIQLVTSEADNLVNSKLWTGFSWIWITGGTVCSF